MASWRRTMMGGLVAAFVALILVVGASAGHAMPVRCDVGHGTAVEASLHHQHHQKQGHDQRGTACCTVTCSLCLTVLPEIAISSSPISGKSRPLLSAAACMTGRVPSPDLGPPRKSV